MELSWQTTPILNPRRRWLRPAGYLLIALILILPVIQFQRGTIKYLERAQEDQEPGAEAGKDHKGAIGRWRREIHDFWLGHNIYLRSEVVEESGVVAAGDGDSRVLHPNMPFVVLLLSPFTWLPVPLMALAFNLCKLVAAAATIWMAAAVVNHRSLRVSDWVAFLGVLASIDFFIGDIQHGNTNTFVAAAVVAHLYFFRRGRDGLAGVFLALGICLKLTPALFILYWLWQRQWKLVGATGAALAAMILIPALFTGWEFFATCMATWWGELIGPSLGGAWYPYHINQSLPAMVGRLFSGGESGNYLWDPDEQRLATEFGWITLIDLGPEGARMLLRGLQCVLVASTVWAIGWARLRRDDGRRALHYGMIAALMLLLNQRSWDHHATYLIISHLAIAYAAARSALPRGTRWWLGGVQIASVVWMLLVSGDLIEEVFGDAGAHRFLAYGTAFWHFLVVWSLCLVVSIKLRGVESPYRDNEGRSDRRSAPSMVTSLPPVT